MKSLDRFACVLAVLFLVVAWADGNAADFQPPVTDGWHAWEVAASAAGTGACCYQWRDGKAVRWGCDLDSGSGMSIFDGDCDPGSDRLRIYVLMDAGKPRQLRALSVGCPVNSRTPVKELGAVSGDASVAWLEAQLGAGRRIAQEALAAISMHADDSAFTSLVGIIEDREQPKKLREEALFWLAHSDRDDAFEYLDAILSRS